MAAGDFLEGYLLAWIPFNVICESAYGETAWRLSAKVRAHGNLLEGVADSTPLRGVVLRNASRTELVIEDPAELSIALEERYVEALIFSQFATHFAELLPSLSDSQKLEYGRLADALCEALKASHGSLLHMLYRRLRMEAVPTDEYGDPRFPVSIDYGRLQRAFIGGDDGNLATLRRAGVLQIVDRNRPQDIVRAVYQVRCNLIHGCRYPSGNSYESVVPAAYGLVEFFCRTALAAMMELPPYTYPAER